MRQTVTSDAALDLTPGMIFNALDALEVDYTASDKEAVVHCPFHDDSGKPHCYVNVQAKPGVFQCFMSDCKAKGDFLAFVMQVTKWNGIKATTFLRGVRRTVPVDLVRTIRPQMVQQDDPLGVYAYRHAYLYDRGLSEDTLQRFDIGYDRTQHAIVFPWFDRHGKLVAIKKRSVMDKRYDYAPGADLAHTLFGLHVVKTNAFLWITEGEIDAMSLDQVFRVAHFDNHFALALGGKEIRDSQIAALLERRPVAVVLMLDRDAVGQVSQEAIRKKLLGRVRVYTAGYPEGSAKDANELTYEQIVKLTTQITQQERDRDDARLRKSDPTP
jgi:DNA primase